MRYLGIAAFALLACAGATPDDGASLYASRCATCHGVGGRGDGPMGVGLDPRPADLTRPALWAAPNLSSVVAAIEGCTPAAQGGMTHASLLAVAGYVRDRFAPLPARFTLSLYLDSPDPTVPSHEAATFDGQTVTVYEDGRLTDRFEVADGDPLPELWSMTTPSGQQGEIYAAFLFDEAFSADRVAALASCHPETTDRLRRCAAGEDCGCVRR